MQSFRFVHDYAENLGRLGICLAYLQKYCQKLTNFRVLSGDLFVFNPVYLRRLDSMFDIVSHVRFFSQISLI